MREHCRRILGVAIFYTGMVAIVDYFLAKMLMISWLALGFVFVFFAALIVDSVVRLLGKDELSGRKIFHGHADDLERLEEIVEKALVQGRSESLRMLEKRLSSLALMARDQRARRFGAQLDRPAENVSQFVSRDLEDDLIVQVLTNSSLVLKNHGSRDVESLLSEIEAWLS
jgi:hypothetical protein